MTAETERVANGGGDLVLRLDVSDDVDVRHLINGVFVVDGGVHVAGLDGHDGGHRLHASRRAEASIAALRKMRNTLYKQCELPRTLKESGKVTYDQLEAIAQMALDDGAIMFNPKEADLKDVRAVLENAWAG